MISEVSSPEERGVDRIVDVNKGAEDIEESTCIFVGGIGKNFTSEELASMFEPYGTVLSASIQRSKTTNKPLGYGFVTLATREEAERCIRSCHRMQLFDQAITVSWAERNRSLLVMHMPPEVTVEEIIGLFETYGAVDREESEEGHGDCGRYILLTLRDRSDAEACRATFNGYSFHGSTLKVVWYQDTLLKRPEPGLARGSKSSFTGAVGGSGMPHQHRGQRRTSSIHVRFFAESGVHVTEASLSKIFEQFGKVVEATIKRAFSDPNGKINRGYGFIHFSGDDVGRASAFAAVETTNNAEIGGILFHTEISNHMWKSYGGSYYGINAPAPMMLAQQRDDHRGNHFDSRQMLARAPHHPSSGSRMVPSIYQYATASQMYTYSPAVNAGAAAPSHIPAGYIYVHHPHVMDAYSNSLGATYPKSYH